MLPSDQERTPSVQVVILRSWICMPCLPYIGPFFFPFKREFGGKNRLESVCNASIVEWSDLNGGGSLLMIVLLGAIVMCFGACLFIFTNHAVLFYTWWQTKQSLTRKVYRPPTTISVMYMLNRMFRKWALSPINAIVKKILGVAKKVEHAWPMQ